MARGGDATMRINEAQNYHMDKCSRFDKCSAPKCPLEKYIVLRVAYPDEPKCAATKRTRFNIGKDLPNHGLTAREMRGYILVYGSKENAIKQLLIRFTMSEEKKKPKGSGYVGVR